MVHRTDTLQVNITSIDAGCTGQNTGSATANVNGGTPSYNYVWNTGATTSQITNLAPGTYTVIITDQNNCTVSSSITINGLQSPTVVINPSPSIIVCEGTPVTLATSVTGTVSYLWNTAETTSSIIVNTSGIYSVTVTENNGCTAIDQVTITVDQLPNSVITGPSSMCTIGQPYQVNNCIGCSYQWSNNCGGTITSPNSSQTIVNWGTATPPCNVNVMVTSQNGVCVSNSSVAINNCCSNGQWCELNDINATNINNSCPGLLSGNTISGQNFIINGDFIVNMNLDIIDCEILLGQNAKIFVNSGFHLRIINNSHLHACNEMWFGIETENEFAHVTIDDSRIEDALNACFATSKGEFDITNTTFNKNYYSIYLQNGQYINSQIEGNIFNCSGILNSNPYNALYSSAHIELYRVDQIIVGSIANGNQFNNDADFSIHMKNSFATFIGNEFNTKSLNSSSAAIYSTGQSKIIVNQNTFNNNLFGIYMLETEATITFNNIYNPVYGIYSAYCTRTTLQITDNLIQNPVTTGIVNFFNHPCIQIIQRNYIWVISNLANSVQGIIIAEFSNQQPGSTFDLQQNTVINVAKGIWLYNLYRPVVKNYNGVDLINSSNLYETSGVELSNCYGATVKYTTVTGNSQSNDLSSGIKIDGSQRSAIQCNNIEDVGLGIFWKGNTLSSYMAGNYMTDCYDHVRLESNPGLGLQGIPAGILPPPNNNGLPLDNRWLGSHLGDEISAYYGSNNNNPTEFYVRPGSPFQPNDIGAYFGSASTQVFTLTGFSGNDYCSFISPNLVSDDEEQVASGEIYSNPGEENEKWIAEEFLFKRLIEDPSLIQNSPLLQAAKDSLIQTNIGEFNAIFDSLNIVLTDTIYADTLSRNIKLDEIETHNSNLNTTWDPELSSQIVNEIYINSIAKFNNVLASSQDATIRYISELCPYKFGQAVFQARAIRAAVDGEFLSYNDNCSQSNNRVLSETITSGEHIINKGLIIPNPNSGIMNYFYTIPIHLSSVQFHIYDLVGKKIATYHLDQFANVLSIDQSLLNQGIYNYKLTTDKSLILDRGIISIIK